MNGESEPLAFEWNAAASREGVKEFGEIVGETLAGFVPQFCVVGVLPLDEFSEDVAESSAVSVIAGVIDE